MKYDVIVIGGGPGGYLAAERSGGKGLKTLLIEKTNIGGVCLNEGCIPSKTFLYSAKIYENIKHGNKYGVYTDNVKYDQKIVLKRKNKVVKRLVMGVKSKLKNNNVDVIEANGKISGNKKEGYLVEAITNGDKKVFTCDYLIIATGSIPIVPPIEGLKEGLKSGYVITNKEILDLDYIPKSITIIGGGVIGLEMASYFSTVGCKVVVVEMLDNVGGSLDSEISENLLKSYKKKGIEFKLGSKVTKLNTNSIIYENKNEIFELESDKVLLSIGRKPNIEDLGLENLNIEVEKNYIKTDNRLNTNIPRVYAIGDVNGKSMLAHTAYREAEVCINNISGKKDLVRYENIPSVIYGNPEIAVVGLTENEAIKKGIEYKKVTLPMMYSGRYIAENEERDGIAKLIVDKKYNKLIGVHMMGSYVSEMIYGAGLMLEMELRTEDIKEIVFPHPTVSEILHEAIHEF